MYSEVHHDCTIQERVLTSMYNTHIVPVLAMVNIKFKGVDLAIVGAPVSNSCLSSLL